MTDDDGARDTAVRERDGATADAIMDAAEALFAGQGFTATTIKQIGAAADANPALIYYYFGSKEGLYRALLDRVFGQIVRTGQARLHDAASPAEAVRALLGAQSEVMQQRPSLPRLLMRELADHGAAHAQQGIATLSATLFSRLRGLIEQGQRTGVFRAEMDPGFAAVSTVSLIPFFHIARPAVSLLLRGEAGGPTPEQVRDYARHAADYALAALTTRGREEG